MWLCGTYDIDFKFVRWWSIARLLSVVNLIIIVIVMNMVMIGEGGTWWWRSVMRVTILRFWWMCNVAACIHGLLRFSCWRVLFYCELCVDGCVIFVGLICVWFAFWLLIGRNLRLQEKDTLAVWVFVHLSHKLQTFLSQLQHRIFIDWAWDPSV